MWAQNNLRSLKATHVPDKMNHGEDMLSRNNVSSGEWTLHPHAVQKILEVLSRAWVDLFTSEDNFHCPVFLAKSMDALAHEWPSLPLYAFPRVALLPQLLFSTARTNGRAISLRDYKKASVQKKRVFQYKRLRCSTRSISQGTEVTIVTEYVLMDRVFKIYFTYLIKYIFYNDILTS